MAVMHFTMPHSTRILFKLSLSVLLTAPVLPAAAQPTTPQPVLDAATPVADEAVAAGAATVVPGTGPFIRWSFRPTMFFLGGQPGEPRSISSTGTCSLVIDPDRARILAVATGGAAAPAEAVAAAATQAAAIVAAVEAMALGDIEVHLASPRTERQAEAQNPGYVVEVAVEFVTSSIDRTGEAEVAIRAVDPGVPVQSIRFVSEPRRQAAEGDCLAIASGNARARAERLAASLGVTLGTVLSVVDATLPTAEPAIRSGKPMGIQTVPVLSMADRLVVELAVVVQFAVE